MKAPRAWRITALAVLAGALCAFDYPFHEGPMERRVEDVPAPAGYERVAVGEGSFARYVRGAPLMPSGTPVRRHDGRVVAGAGEVVAVLDMPLLNDMQQCADSALRYWFEYQHEGGNADALAARLTSGEIVRFGEWRSHHARASDGPRKTFLRFLSYCMAYVGSWSLDRDLPAITAPELLPGDVIVQPSARAGGIGHLSIVFDVAAGPGGRRAYLVGYGFLPAQSVFIALPEPGNAVAPGSPWFTRAGFESQHSYLGARFTYRRFAAPVDR